MSHLAQFEMILLFFALGVVASWSKSDLEVEKTKLAPCREVLD